MTSERQELELTPDLLEYVKAIVLKEAYNETPATWRSFCAVRSVSDFKTNTAIRPSFTGALQPVAPTPRETRMSLFSRTPNRPRRSSASFTSTPRAT